MDRYQANKNIREAIMRRIESVKNGIVIHYHDCLSWDKWQIYIRKDGEYVKHPALDWDPETCTMVVIDRPSTGNYMDVDMYNPSDYYRSLGVRRTVEELCKEYPELPVYTLDLGWYTFPRKYMKRDRDAEYIRKGEWPWVKKHKHLHVPVLLEYQYAEED